MVYLHSYKAVFSVIVQTEEGKKDLGLLKEEVKLFSEDGEKFIERIQTMDKIGLIDTCISKAYNLSPVYHAGHNSSGYMKIKFSKTKAKGVRYFSKNDSTFIIDQTMPAPYFDSNNFEVVLSLLPLDSNFEADIPFFQFESGGYTMYSSRVIGEETISDNNTTRKVWVLVTSFGDSETTFYIAKDNREIIKKINNRANNTKVTFNKVF